MATCKEVGIVSFNFDGLFFKCAIPCLFLIILVFSKQLTLNKCSI